jgi:RHS repeat-associated protein
MYGAYRYGFNGKENDNEVKGSGNQQDYGMRIYDPRLGRFLSVDPLTKTFPMLTPYQFASNTPIQAVDLDGLEAMPFHSSMYRLGHVTETTEAQTLGGTICRMTSSHTIVISVYENIPEVIRNPSTNDFSMVYGGPVGINGEDDNRPSIHPEGRYYNNGPQFWGLGESSTNPSISPSTRGNYLRSSSSIVVPDGLRGSEYMEVNKANSDQIRSVASAPQHIYGMAMNWFNIGVREAMNDEYSARNSFYDATQTVDKINSYKGFGGASLSVLQRVHLINFMTDGTLFTDNLNSKAWTMEGITSALDIANHGVQVLNRVGMLQNQTRKNVSNLLQIFQEMGGDASRYSTMTDALKTVSEDE